MYSGVFICLFVLVCFFFFFPCDYAKCFDKHLDWKDFHRTEFHVRRDLIQEKSILKYEPKTHLSRVSDLDV